MWEDASSANFKSSSDLRVHNIEDLI